MDNQRAGGNQLIGIETEWEQIGSIMQYSTGWICEPTQASELLKTFCIWCQSEVFIS